MGKSTATPQPDPTTAAGGANGTGGGAGTVTTETQNGKTDTQPGGATPPNSTQTATASDEGRDQVGEAGKRAIQNEREAREKAEQEAQSIRAELDQFKTALAQALGIKDKDESDPAALTAQLQQRDADLAAKSAEVAVLRAGYGIANLDMLLDSKRFTDTLTDLDVSDAAKVKAHIEKWVEDNPQFKAAKTVPGARDAGAGRGREVLPEPQPGQARMAAGFEAELSK